jgi:hypothetical protein
MFIDIWKVKRVGIGGGEMKMSDHQFWNMKSGD